MFEDALEVRDRLAVLVDRLDPDAVSGSTAGELWAVLDACERLCAAGKTLLARRLKQAHRPETAGAKTAAEHLARKAGTSTGVATDALDTSARLPGQPAVEQALRRGQLSAAQAAVVSAAAAADPAAEARLVELASRVSVPELREECARVKAAADPDPEGTNRRLHQRRRLRRWVDSEGFWTLQAKGTPQAGAAFGAALDALTDQIFRQARRDGRHEPVEAYAFDALMSLADRAADRAAGSAADRAAGSAADRTAGQTVHPAAVSAADRQNSTAGNGPTGTADGLPTTGGDVATGGDPATPPAAPASAVLPGRPSRMNPRFLALLRVDVETLRRGRVAGDELCEIRGVGPVPVPVAAGLLGQSVLQLVITRGVDVLNVTHLGRGPTAAQKIALAWASPGCTVQGCWRTRVEHDHRQPWAETRHTRLDELDPLCEFHHDLKTRHGWALVAGTGKRPMVPPDDPRHPKRRADPETAGRPRARDTHAASVAVDGAGPTPRTVRSSRRSRPEQPTLPDPPGDPPRAA
jgi:hypothetical protein